MPPAADLIPKQQQQQVNRGAYFSKSGKKSVKVFL